MTALAVGVLLSIFAAAFLSHLAADYHTHRTRQRAIQALWNARAGLEHYRATGQLPPVDRDTREREVPLEGAGERCRVHLDPADGDIRFEGVSGGIHRSLILVGGDPERLVVATQ